MKTLALLLWMFCREGKADHGIYVSSLDECTAMGLAIAIELRTLGEPLAITWACDYVEAPVPDPFCFT